MTKPPALQKDLNQIEKARELPSSSDIAEVSKASGISPFKLMGDFRKLKRAPGKLEFGEYLKYQLYDRERYSDEERKRFISAYQHWDWFADTTELDWWTITEDKWVSSTLLKGAGLPTPKTAAVVDTTTREYPDTQVLRNADDVAKFLSVKKNLPIFAKSQSSMWSAGAFVIEKADKAGVTVKGEAKLGYKEFFDSYIGETPFIFQEQVQPHKFFDGVTEAIATIRTFNLIKKDGSLFNPFAVLKLPLGPSIADNFWRDENLVCAVDVETGKILTLVGSEKMNYVQHEALPGSKRKMIGETIPMWKEIQKLNQTVAMMHHDVKYGSTDIGLSKDGPIVIEVNCGSAFELAQIATGKGFLTDEVISFFKEYGSKRV